MYECRHILSVSSTGEGGDEGMVVGGSGKEAGGKIRTRVVYIIEDEAGVQRALGRLMKAAGLSSRGFESVEEFMATEIRAEDSCVVADIDLGGSTSLDLPSRLEQAGLTLPVIFITAWDSREIREQVRRAGGAGYFRKPVDDQALIDAINWAIGAVEARQFVWKTQQESEETP